MLLTYLVNDKKDIQGLVIHVLLGILSLLSIYFFILWVYLVMATASIGIVNRRTRSRSILLISGYMLGIELMGRMLKADPFIPYQLGSYFMLMIFTLGILDHYRTSKTNIGFLIILFCVPAFFMISSNDYLASFIDALSGIVCTGLAAIYFSRQRFTRTDIMNFMKCAVLPVVAIFVYLFFKTPAFSDIQFDLKANFKTSGGFGSNQVSTILGAGAFLLLMPYLQRGGLFRSYKILNLMLIAGFMFRGLLTFSRGGMLGCLCAVLLSYLYLAFTDGKNIGRNIFRMLLYIFLAVSVFQISDVISGGNLTRRYMGETGGTVEGTREKDLRVITSGRNELVEAEWYVFKDNFILGVGPGNGYEARRGYVGRTIASHTEVTRLLSEQGLPGLFIAVIFLIFPFVRIARAKSREERYYLIGFFSLAIITSFHSSMRTMLTPLLWGLGCADFLMYEKNSLKKVAPRRQNRLVSLNARGELLHA